MSFTVLTKFVFTKKSVWVIAGKAVMMLFTNDIRHVAGALQLFPGVKYYLKKGQPRIIQLQLGLMPLAFHQCFTFWLILFY